ncbi:hypothetical protein Murru_0885 [Allomuricauda ruestringensis DSM 13258]|uniref:Uncharacterized protein n=1 Tax=Allomuricauda ruestringensis (strain DSM 13258 / CIP 107369 / LMG 19739 / B1) TaxID=886377 RepID=G2PKV3_ALLRU|nr:hypothetical protein Murru_0885 [Allomuricauda ruestringensis DSM 13258]
MNYLSAEASFVDVPDIGSPPATDRQDPFATKTNTGVY